MPVLAGRLVLKLSQKTSWAKMIRSSTTSSKQRRFASLDLIENCEVFGRNVAFSERQSPKFVNVFPSCLHDCSVPKVREIRGFVEKIQDQMIAMKIE